MKTNTKQEDFLDKHERDMVFISVYTERIRCAIATLEIVNNAKPDKTSRDLAIKCILTQAYSALEALDNILN